MAMEGEAAPLHKAWVQQPRAFINRAFTLLHSCMLLAMFYYRATTVFPSPTSAVLLAQTLAFMAEAAFAFFWLLRQPFGWRPMSRDVFPECLPADELLPNIDVFVCTADPEKEPVVEVMNTVIAAMSMDYPADKLVVYLSDDGGSSAKLNALREVAAFATAWLPYCRTYGVVTRSPEAYFSSPAPLARAIGIKQELIEEREKMKLLYQDFKKRVLAFDRGGKSTKNRPALIEVIGNMGGTAGRDNSDKAKTSPTLVYVSREKKTSIDHHYKAGALNVLLRVSSILSNAPYILVLDCDMCSNDPSSARQAMCFHLDRNLSPTLAYVQFPQVFGNVSFNDIYGTSLRWGTQRYLLGMDGLGGPSILGTGFYIKRSALLGELPGEAKTNKSSINHIEVPNSVASQVHDQYRNNATTTGESRLNEAHILASCAYEEHTKWGKEVGFLYNSVAEDFFTGFVLRCRGWRSVYLNPSRPAFLGTTPITMQDTIIQGKRWSSGLLQVALSRFCPLTFGATRISIPMSLCFASLAFWAFQSVLLCYALVHLVCFFNGISLYPKVSSPWFFVFLGNYLLYMVQNVVDSLIGGITLKQWWCDERSWMMKVVSAFVFGSLSVILKQFIGITRMDFELTNKAGDDEQTIERYSKDVFDFQDTGLLITPLITLAITNVACFAIGVWRMVRESSCDPMAGEVILTGIILIYTQPILEGILVRNDRGRVPTSPILLSMLFSAIVLSFGYVAFNYH